eukprot:TRINITY_DN22751_c0_g1_i1.p1 TRINITY_DN22751_c0_g1~~TRINITY_DN22751_c0_g1_i1.p1  ORF type:complete len:529 (-),score=72.16 TRINITY_DN22751_c0_g1_i1:563-2149(-)
MTNASVDVIEHVDTSPQDLEQNHECQKQGVGEFEREQVPEHAYKSYLSFLAIFCGRHTAGTEFSIGPLFIVHGAAAKDVIFGLLLGNILATLSWRFFCAPVAVRKRYTTFYYLEGICGRKIVLLYNLFVGLILCMLGGAMYSVSATAVGILFKTPMPGLHDWFPTSLAFSAVVVFVGIVTAVIATFGYSTVSRLSLILSPYMLGVIIYMGVVSLKRLEVTSFSDFWNVATEVWPGSAPEPGYAKFGFWHCVCTAWFCDLILHIGMLDLSILRYAKSSNAGWCSAIGMFLGHYFTWIVAGLLYALQLRADPDDKAVKPGPMAQNVAGINGLLCVIAAGWSTANPIIYAAGLALQSILGEGWGTRSATMGAGLIATFFGLFPAAAMRIIELLAYAGLLLMPMGIVIFCHCFVLPALFPQQPETFQIPSTALTMWPALVAWVLTNAVMIPLAVTGVTEVFFAPLPGILLAATTFLSSMWLSLSLQQRNLKQLENNEKPNKSDEETLSSAETDVNTSSDQEEGDCSTNLSSV